MENDKVSKLLLLKELYDKGSITAEQLAAEKARIMSGSDDSTPKPEDEAPIKEGMNNVIDEGGSPESSAQDDITQTIEKGAPGESREPKKANRKKISISIAIAVSVIILAAIFIFNHKNNSIWVNNQDGGQAEEVYNRRNTVYYNGYGKTFKLFPNSEAIEITYLSFAGGKIQSRTITQPVSDFIDINYDCNGLLSLYRFIVDTDNGIAYMTNENKPLEALVYVISTNRYYHVSSLDPYGDYYIQDHHTIEAKLLKKFLGENQLQAFKDRHMGRLYRVVSIDGNGNVELKDRRGFYYEDRYQEPMIYTASIDGTTEEEQDIDFITGYLRPFARMAEAESFFDEIAVIDNDYLKGLARVNELQANREYANGDLWYFIIDAANIYSLSGDYAYKVYEEGGFQIYTNDIDFTKIGYPANLIIKARVSSVSSDGIHYLRDAELLGIQSNRGITTYDGTFLENQRVRRASRDW